MPLFLLQARRTPYGSLGGSLKGHPAPALAAAALEAVLAGVEKGRVGACILGQAVQAGAGPNPALEAARLAGLPCGGATFTVNQGRASGLQAIFLAAAMEADLVVAGGMESASQAPYLLPSARWGTRMGKAPVLDSLLQDARWPLPAFLEAAASGTLLEELVPLETDQDDPVPPGSGPAPADGAAAVLLGSEAQAALHPPLARIAAMVRGNDLAEARDRALALAGWSRSQDLLEPEDPVASAPGADGARKVVTLAHRLQAGGPRHGLVALACEGTALALLLERP